MDVESCYDVCREYNGWLRRQGLNIEKRRSRIWYCRKMCRQKGRPPITVEITMWGLRNQRSK